MTLRPRGRSGLIGAIIAVIVVVIIIITVLILAFVPFRSLPVDESRQAELGSGVETLEMNLTIDAGEVNVKFVDDSTVAANMTVTGERRSGLFGAGGESNVSWSENTSGSALSITSRIDVSDSIGPFSPNNINCTLIVSRQLRTDLRVLNSAGSVNVDLTDQVNISSLSITTSVGGITLSISENATLEGDMTLEAPVGGIDLRWNDVKVNDGGEVTLRTDTGGIRASITQAAAVGTNATFAMETNVGGIDLTMDLSGENSARVVSTAGVGGVSVRGQSGFNGTSGDLASRNYPSSSNFEVSCRANVGGVNLDLRYAD